MASRDFKVLTCNGSIGLIQYYIKRYDNCYVKELKRTFQSFIIICPVNSELINEAMTVI